MMDFKKLLIIHAIITFTAGIVLIVMPNLIPGSVDISLEPDAYLICYLLAASELSLATLSFFGRKIENSETINLIALTCIVLHASSGILEVYAMTQGLSTKIWGNILLRVIVVAAFVYYGFYKNPKHKSIDTQ